MQVSVSYTVIIVQMIYGGGILLLLLMAYLFSAYLIGYFAFKWRTLDHREQVHLLGSFAIPIIRGGTDKYINSTIG